MKIVVTGAAGLLGSRLIRALLSAPSDPGTLTVIGVDTAPCPVRDARLETRVGTIEDPSFVRSLVDADVGVVFHLAAVLSGGSEDDFDAGMRVNVDGTRAVLEACRGTGRSPRFVFASTIAVFGGDLPPVVPEDLALTPQTSYGSEKAIAELLVSDYSRRGFVDGVACRLASVTVRPGKPNSALSSFVSGILREPLAGIDTTCPVPLDTPLWITSPRTATENLAHAARIDTARLGMRRMLNLPGLRVTAGEMLDSLERVGGAAARARVRVERDERVARAMLGWPGALDDSRAVLLGFVRDTGIDAIVRQHLAESGVRS
jgi:D-erythronate 2-dehydrogenase